MDKSIAIENMVRQFVVNEGVGAPASMVGYIQVVEDLVATISASTQRDAMRLQNIKEVLRKMRSLERRRDRETSLGEG